MVGVKGGSVYLLSSQDRYGNCDAIQVTTMATAEILAHEGQWLKGQVGTMNAQSAYETRCPTGGRVPDSIRGMSSEIILAARCAFVETLSPAGITCHACSALIDSGDRETCLTRLTVE